MTQHKPKHIPTAEEIQYQRDTALVIDKVWRLDWDFRIPTRLLNLPLERRQAVAQFYRQMRACLNESRRNKKQLAAFENQIEQDYVQSLPPGQSIDAETLELKKLEKLLYNDNEYFMEDALYRITKYYHKEFPVSLIEPLTLLLTKPKSLWLLGFALDFLSGGGRVPGTANLLADTIQNDRSTDPNEATSIRVAAMDAVNRYIDNDRGGKKYAWKFTVDLLQILLNPSERTQVRAVAYQYLYHWRVKTSVERPEQRTMEALGTEQPVDWAMVRRWRAEAVARGYTVPDPAQDLQQALTAFRNRPIPDPPPA